MLRSGLWYSAEANAFFQAVPPPHPGKVGDPKDPSNGMFAFNGAPTMFGNANRCDANGLNCEYKDVVVRRTWSSTC